MINIYNEKHAGNCNTEILKVCLPTWGSVIKTSTGTLADGYHDVGM
jgi:hypothetical protein